MSRQSLMILPMIFAAALTAESALAQSIPSSPSRQSHVSRSGPVVHVPERPSAPGGGAVAPPFTPPCGGAVAPPFTPPGGGAVAPPFTPPGGGAVAPGFPRGREPIEVRPELPDRQDPEEIYDRAVHGVIWIVNHLPQKNAIAMGSGFIVDRERGIAITNYHVAAGEQTMDVFFPARRRGGPIVSDPKFYKDNIKDLHRLRFHAVGTVIAQSEAKDLAVLSLDRMPDSAVALDLGDDNLPRGAGLSILGNPADRDLWRMTRGTVRGISRFSHVFEDDGMRVNFRALDYVADSFHGNSGGPVLDDAGRVVGVAESGGGEGGFRSTAVSVSEVRAVLRAIGLVREAEAPADGGAGSRPAQPLDLE